MVNSDRDSGGLIRLFWKILTVLLSAALAAILSQFRTEISTLIGNPAVVTTFISILWAAVGAAICYAFAHPQLQRLRVVEASVDELQEKNSILDSENVEMKAKADSVKIRLEKRNSNGDVGGVWCEEPRGDVAKPTPRGGRKTRFISVINLKGGVGKTTLSTGLSAALAKFSGQRVLLVDLDFQGTASNASIDPQVRNAFLRGRYNTDHVAESSACLLTDIPGDHLAKIVEPMQGVEGVDVIQAHERLDQIDVQEMFAFALEDDDDVRFRHCHTLFQKEIVGLYDYVIFDCPPRLTTSSVNALACSDAFLVPTKLEADSTDAVGRTLRWMQLLGTNEITQAIPLGIAINEVPMIAGKVMSKYRDSLSLLKNRAAEYRGPNGESVPLLLSMIKQFNNFGILEPGKSFFTLTEAQEPLLALAKEVDQKLQSL